MLETKMQANFPFVNRLTGHILFECWVYFMTSARQKTFGALYPPIQKFFDNLLRTPGTQPSLNQVKFNIAPCKKISSPPTERENHQAKREASDKMS